MESITSIMTIVILSFFGLFVLIGAFKGFRQGAPRQVIRTATIAVAVVVSLLIAKAFYGKVEQFFEGKTMQEIHDWIIGLEILPAETDISFILNLDPVTIKNVVIIPLVLLIIPIAFTLLFFIFLIITKIIHVIICGVVGLSKKRKNTVTSLIGMVLGIVEGIAVAAIFLLPISGLAHSAGVAINTLNKEMPENETTIELTTTYNEVIAPISDNPLIKITGKCGINALYSGLVTHDVDGKSTDMSELLPDAALIYANTDGLKEFKWDALTDKNKESLNNISDIIENNGYFSSLIANAISEFAKSYNDGKFNIDAPDPFDGVLDELVTIFETTDTTNLHTDIDTILAVYYVLSDDNVLAAFKQDADILLDTLTTKRADGETPVNHVINTINANARLKPIVTTITNISISVMQKQLGLTEDTMQAVESIKGGLNDTLKIDRNDFSEGDEGHEEYKAAVSESLDTTLKDNGINLQPEIVDTMADYVIENYGDKEEMTDEEFNDVILSYFDAYVDYKETGKLPDDLPEGVDPDDLENLIPGIELP